MTSQQLQQLNLRLNQWRAGHMDTKDMQAAYRQQVIEFTLSSMALENEPVNPQRLATLLCQPAR